MRTIEIYTPLYNCVYEIFIGLKEGCTLLPAVEYPNKIPVVFYGSSITQGGCASHPGNDYVSIVCRDLGLDYVNLGFSGNAKGEPIMADYLANLQAKIMVLDYDFNAPSVEWLKQTHYPLYQKIRAAQPDVPIVFMTRPNFLYDPKVCTPRREVIYNNYLQAQKNGDKNVYFIDGETLLGGEDWHLCTVDNCHPNDLGFYRMAMRVKSVLQDILGNE
jgi:lysophospholipase L1-like esterase